LRGGEAGEQQRGDGEEGEMERGAHVWEGLSNPKTEIRNPKEARNPKPEEVDCCIS
jgi:hypothetical protein